ncbi:MAG TPA: hypothetical protein VKV96_00115 [Roseiarcus sp.]|nr:hypothetical protein [Roseiarcus sp.]
MADESLDGRVCRQRPLRLSEQLSGVPPMISRFAFLGKIEDQARGVAELFDPAAVRQTEGLLEPAASGHFPTHHAKYTGAAATTSVVSRAAAAGRLSKPRRNSRSEI